MTLRRLAPLHESGTIEHVAVQRMEHVGIVVDDLAAATKFFVERGFLLQGEGRSNHSLSNQGDNRHAPANTPGIRHIVFAVKDIDAVVTGLRACGAELDGELERYEDRYRLCYVRAQRESSLSGVNYKFRSRQLEFPTTTTSISQPPAAALLRFLPQ